MRKVIITKSGNLVGLQDLITHPEVLKCWQLPREYTLVEVRDPTLHVIESDIPCPPARCAALASMGEGMLFAPFHKRMKSPASLATLHLRTHTAAYHLIAETRRVSQWPLVAFSPSWEISPHIEVRCRLNSDLADRFEALETTIFEWALGMKQLGKPCALAPVLSHRRKHVVRCQFAEPCGDQIMALLMLLAEAATDMCLKSVGFRLFDFCTRPGTAASLDRTDTTLEKERVVRV
jgi:hypothetical protein